MTRINAFKLINTANHKVVEGFSALFRCCFRIISLLKGAWNNETALEFLAVNGNEDKKRTTDHKYL